MLVLGLASAAAPKPISSAADVAASHAFLFIPFTPLLRLRSPRLRARVPEASCFVSKKTSRSGYFLFPPDFRCLRRDPSCDLEVEEMLDGERRRAARPA